MVRQAINPITMAAMVDEFVKIATGTSGLSSTLSAGIKPGKINVKPLNPPVKPPPLVDAGEQLDVSIAPASPQHIAPTLMPQAVQQAPGAAQVVSSIPSVTTSPTYQNGGRP